MKTPLDFLTGCAFLPAKTKHVSIFRKLAFPVLVLCGFLATPVFAQDTLGFKVAFSKAKPKIGDTVEVIFTAKIPKGWHLFSEKTDCLADDGPIRAEFTFESDTSFESTGDLYGVGDTMIKDEEVWKCSSGQFYNSCDFRQKIVVKGPIHNTAHFYGQKCSDQDGLCYLVKEDIPVTLVPAKR